MDIDTELYVSLKEMHQKPAEQSEIKKRQKVTKMLTKKTQLLCEQFNYHAESEVTTPPVEDKKSCNQASKFVPQSKVSKHKHVAIVCRVHQISYENSKILEQSTELGNAESIFNRKCVHHYRSNNPIKQIQSITEFIHLKP